MQANSPLIKNPFNYTGGKFRLMPQILPHFPDDIECFFDVFAGGGDVYINTPAWKYKVNDNLRQIIDLQRWFYDFSLPYVLRQLKVQTKAFELSRENKEGYLALREYYSHGAGYNLAVLYLLICHSNSNMIRFNSTGDFNVPFGKRTFNINMQANLTRFMGALHEKSIGFTSFDFRSLVFEQGDFVFCDPPYMTGVAPYNTGWSEYDERSLYSTLDTCDKAGIKFVLINAIENNGNVNEILRQWMGRYHIIYLSNDYKGSNYHRKNKGETQEILVMNY